MALRNWTSYIALHPFTVSLHCASPQSPGRKGYPVTVCTDQKNLQSWHKENLDTFSRTSHPKSHIARALGKV